MTRQQQIGYALILVAILAGITWYTSQFIQPMLPPSINNSVILFFAALLAVLGGLAAFKDTIELIHIFSGREQRALQQLQPVFQTNFNKKVDAQVIVTGGQNVTINAAPQQPINDKIVYAESLQQQAELFQKVLGENIRQNFFWKAKVEAYSEAWRILQTVRVVGDSLWEKASQENILAFAGALKSATNVVQNDAIFFEKDEYQELLKLVDEFKHFHVGKERIIELRSNAHLDAHQIREIQRQVDRNRAIKEKYESLLDQIMESFRTRLSR
jgi:hypothetical protein